MAGDFESLEDLLPVSPLPMLGRKKLHKYKYKITCKRGHTLRGENLVIRKAGNRTTKICKACHDMARAKWKENNPDYKTPKRLAKQTRPERIAELEKALLEVLLSVNDSTLKEHYEKIARGEK